MGICNYCGKELAKAYYWELDRYDYCSKAHAIAYARVSVERKTK